MIEGMALVTTLSHVCLKQTPLGSTVRVSREFKTSRYRLQREQLCRRITLYDPVLTFLCLQLESSKCDALSWKYDNYFFLFLNLGTVLKISCFVKFWPYIWQIAWVRTCGMWKNTNSVLVFAIAAVVVP